MKKQLFLASALALVTLASCGGNNKGGLKVGLICLHDKASTYDKNFIDAFEASCEEAKKNGYIADYKYVTDVEEEGSPCSEAAERFVNQGYNVIFSDSFGHNDNLQEVAAKYPNVLFSSATGDTAHIANLPNFHNAFASIYEGRYLAGVAAGEYLKQTEKGADVGGKVIQLGYVGAYPFAEVVSGYTSWFLGVKSTYEHATVKMQVEFTDSWYDEVAEGNAATKLIDENHCILISQHADSMGAPNVCAARGIPNVSYNMNTSEMSEICKDTYIAHSRINWKPYYDAVLKTAIGSRFDEENNNWTGTLGTDSVQYNVSSLVKEAGQQKVKEAAEKLKNGTLHVFDTSTFTVGGNPVSSFEIDLNGDGTPEIETVTSDGSGKSWIQESYFRSAPYFDLNIDGITGRE